MIKYSVTNTYGKSWVKKSEKMQLDFFRNGKQKKKELNFRTEFLL